MAAQGSLRVYVACGSVENHPRFRVLARTFRQETCTLEQNGGWIEVFEVVMWRLTADMKNASSIPPAAARAFSTEAKILWRLACCRRALRNPGSSKFFGALHYGVPVLSTLSLHFLYQHGG